MEHDQPMQHAVDGAVVEARRDDCGALERIDDRGRPARQSTLEEWKRVGVEEPTIARRQHERPVFDSIEDDAKERQELPIRAEAVVHALRMRARVVREPLVEPSEAQVLVIRRVLDGQETLVFGIEQEDHPQDDAEHALVEVVVLGLECGAQPVVAALTDVTRCGGLEASDEQLHGLEHLLGERVGDIGLAPSALSQQPLERVLGRRAVRATRMKE